MDNFWAVEKKRAQTTRAKPHGSIFDILLAKHLKENALFNLNCSNKLRSRWAWGVGVLDSDTLL
jgi:hypothetical protein